MNAQIDFRALVSQIRKVRELTQEQLAQELGVTFGTVNGWENGKHRPSPLAAKELIRIATEAGVAFDASRTARPRSSRGTDSSKSAGRKTRRGSAAGRKRKGRTQ